MSVCLLVGWFVCFVCLLCLVCFVSLFVRMCACSILCLSCFDLLGLALLSLFVYVCFIIISYWFRVFVRVFVSLFCLTLQLKMIE